jgi:type IV pilus assembly protein PilE
MSRSVRQGGFTLVEIMIVVALIGILSAIALPQYSDYVRRSSVQEAISALSSEKSRIEQWYQDNRFYTTTPTTTTCGITPTNVKKFTLTCVATSQTFTLTATANTSTNVAGIVYTVNQLDERTTVAPVWGVTASVPRWVTKKGD